MKRVAFSRYFQRLIGFDIYKNLCETTVESLNNTIQVTEKKTQSMSQSNHCHCHSSQLSSSFFSCCRHLTLFLVPCFLSYSSIVEPPFLSFVSERHLWSSPDGPFCRLSLYCLCSQKHDWEVLEVAGSVSFRLRFICCMALMYLINALQ